MDKGPWQDTVYRSQRHDRRDGTHTRGRRPELLCFLPYRNKTVVIRPGDLTRNPVLGTLTSGFPASSFLQAQQFYGFSTSMPIPRVYFSYTLPSGVSRVMSLLLWEQFGSQCRQPWNKAGGHTEGACGLRLPGTDQRCPGPVPRPFLFLPV